MSFLDELWAAVEPVYQKTIEHPYNVELANGTLDFDSFRFYISQDVIYISQYARALALMAGREADSGRMYEFISFAKEGLDIERALHEHYMTHFDVKPAKEPSLATEAYSNFLLTTVMLRTPAEAMSALLPCFWMYGKVAEHIYSNAQPENPFQKWIDTYAGEEFDETTARLKEITEMWAGKVEGAMHKRMKQYFLRSARYEYYFWDSAYYRRMW